MTIYARSDVVAVARPVDSGGCGQIHRRPVVNGAPVKVFALACPLCEIALLDDPCWAAHPDLIPRTADEERAAKKLADEGTGTMRQVAEALALSAGKILHEQEQHEAEQAAEMARHAAAAEAERAAAAAERARAETQARLREANRVAEAVVMQVEAAEPARPQARPAVVKAAAPVKTVPDFPAEVHPSRKCVTCGGTLTRKAHSAGRWPGSCLTCREGTQAA